jgi:predicted RNA binding protein with dsRBD fold (UPF0201 family)
VRKILKYMIMITSVHASESTMTAETAANILFAGTSLRCTSDAKTEIDEVASEQAALYRNVKSFLEAILPSARKAFVQEIKNTHQSVEDFLAGFRVYP